MNKELPKIVDGTRYPTLVIQRSGGSMGIDYIGVHSVSSRATNYSDKFESKKDILAFVERWLDADMSLSDIEDFPKCICDDCREKLKAQVEREKELIAFFDGKTDELHNPLQEYYKKSVLDWMGKVPKERKTLHD